jgi:hypothetical protein
MAEQFKAGTAQYDALLVKLDAAQKEIEFLRPKYNEAAELVRRVREERFTLMKEAARYRWLRADNAYAPEEAMVRGGPALDRLCDEGLAATSSGDKTS